MSIACAAFERRQVDTCDMLRGDCMEVLPSLPAKSVQCVVTSPPYFQLRAYLPKDHPDKHKEIGSEPTPSGFIATMVAVFREVRRVLRDDGAVFINLGDSYNQYNANRGPAAGINKIYHESLPSVAGGLPAGAAAGNLLNIPHRVAAALQADGWVWRQTVVWQKRSPLPESVAGWRWMRCRVKAGKSNRADGWKGESTDGRAHGGYAEDGKSFDLQASWLPCPGCDKCEPNPSPCPLCNGDGRARIDGRDVGRCIVCDGKGVYGGYVLRRGSGRCTTAHEFVFIFAKQQGYFWDSEASKEESAEPQRAGKVERTFQTSDAEVTMRMDGGREVMRTSHRNPRSVWSLSSEPCRVKHFATMPSELVRRCLVAGTSAGGCCSICGAPYAPVVDSERVPTRPGTNAKSHHKEGRENVDPQRHVAVTRTHGYRPTCNCAGQESAGCVVLDPFGGIGTTAQTARQLGCRAISIELNEEYHEVACKRVLEPPRWWLRQQKEGKKRRTRTYKQCDLF